MPEQKRIRVLYACDLSPDKDVVFKKLAESSALELIRCTDAPAILTHFQSKQIDFNVVIICGRIPAGKARTNIEVDAHGRVAERTFHYHLRIKHSTPMIILTGPQGGWKELLRREDPRLIVLNHHNTDKDVIDSLERLFPAKFPRTESI